MPLGGIEDGKRGADWPRRSEIPIEKGLAGDDLHAGFAPVPHPRTGLGLGRRVKAKETGLGQYRTVTHMAQATRTPHIGTAQECLVRGLS
jgi:hypothetical protein